MEDKFCDAEELKRSLENIVIHPSVCVFFSTLFDINQTKLMSHGSGKHSCVSNDVDTMNEQDSDRDCMHEGI